MTDEYQNAVKKLVDYIGDTVNFAKDQLPDVAKEILVYGAQMNHFWLIIWCTLAAIGFISWLIGIFTDEEGAMFIGFIAMVFSILFSANCYMHLVKIETAPKLYVLQELSGMIDDKK